MSEKEEWTMIVTHSDGSKSEFTGKRTLTELLLGVKSYIEKQTK